MVKVSRKIFIKMTIAIIIVLIVATFGVLSLPQFGKKAVGSRKKRIQDSPNFKDGKFQNVEFTPDLTEGVSYFTILGLYFKKYINKEPKMEIPFIKTDLKSIDKAENRIIWFGHSSYLLFFEGKSILVDPVFSGYASPFSFLLNAYKGANRYLAADMPEIDILIITHDHYDHLDYDTMKKLMPKVKSIVTSLGVGEHLQHWGFDQNIITELDWNEQHNYKNQILITACTTRHFSGRGLSPKTTLWGSFVLKGNKETIYIGGDSGYGAHFKEIGEKHGPFDLVILDGGQYHEYWKAIHMIPEETAQAALDLKAKKLFPVHWSKFTMAFHDWNEPVKRVTAAANAKDLPYFTAKIGESNNWVEKVGGEQWWA
jgi:L-ascorbate metabolism protein UlaG (beta-lactamase superfamily)